LQTTELAPAKINLALHVLGRRADGYHELDSIVAFAQIGDRLSFAAADEWELEIVGPFAPSLSIGGENLVLRPRPIPKPAANTASRSRRTCRLPQASAADRRMRPRA